MQNALPPGQYENHVDQSMSTVRLWDSRCRHNMALNGEGEWESDVSQSANLAACGGSEQRIAVVSELLFRQKSPPSWVVTKTAWQLLYTQRTQLPTINLDVKILSCQFSERSSTVSFSSYIALFNLSIWYSIMRPSQCSKLLLPTSKDCVTLSPPRCFQLLAIYNLGLLQTLLVDFCC